MRKIKFTVLLSLFMLAMVFTLSGCSSKLELTAPDGLAINNDSYMLYWYEVPDARKYEVEVTSQTGGVVLNQETRRNNLSLNTLAEGSYIVRVRAVGGKNMNVFSDWSKGFSFTPEADTGVVYTLSNNGTEYTVSGLSAGFKDETVIIDDYHRGRPVTSIRSGAFGNKEKITGIVIGKNVTTIGDNAFINCTSLRSISIPDTVATIGKSAFRGCSALEEVKLSDLFTTVPELTFAYCEKLNHVDFGSHITSIGKSAFVKCNSLTEMVFPESVTTIGEEAFYSNASLKKVIFSPAVSYIGKSAFMNCGALDYINFDTLELSGSLAIDQYAFLGAAITELDIPYGTYILGAQAFADCKKLARVTIPETVTTIQVNCFTGTDIYNRQAYELDENGSPRVGEDGEYIEKKALVYVDKWLVTCTQTLKLDKDFKFLTDEEHKNNREVEGATNFDQVWTFREDTVGIADQAFYFIGQNADGSFFGSEIYRVFFPKNLKYIGNTAFGYCTKLNMIQMLYTNSLEVVGSYAFAYCENLEIVQFKSGLKTIDSAAFYKCKLLRNNEMRPNDLTPETLTRIGVQAFYETAMWTETMQEGSGAAKLVFAGNWLVGYDYNILSSQGAWTWDGELPENIVGVSDYALYGNKFLVHINLSRVKYIGRSAFSYCVALQGVDLNRMLSVIEPFTFFNCQRLASVEFPTQLKSIGSNAFAYCNALANINLAGCDLLEEIDEYAFLMCRNVTEVRFNSNIQIKEIKPYTFYGCESLVSFKLPLSVTSIGTRAFSYCKALSEVDFSENTELKSIGTYAFRECEKLQTIKLGDGVESIGDFAFYKCVALSDISFGKNLKTIGKYAFAYNTSLKGLFLPENIERINAGAFSNCTSLRSVSLPVAVKYMDTNVFYNDTKATIYVGADSVEFAEWSPSWNASYRTVVANATFNEDGSVNTITITNGSIANIYTIYGLYKPYRKGYKFVGWATDANDPTTIVSVKDVAAGTTLYACWEEGEEEIGDQPSDQPGSDQPGSDQPSDE